MADTFRLLMISSRHAELVVTSRNTVGGAKTWRIKRSSNPFQFDVSVNGNKTSLANIDGFDDTFSYKLNRNTTAFFMVNNDINQVTFTPALSGVFDDLPRGDQSEKRLPKDQIRSIHDLKRFFRLPDITILDGLLILPVGNLLISPPPYEEQYEEKSFFFIELKYDNEGRKRRYQVLKQENQEIHLSKESIYGDLDPSKIDVDQHTLFYRQYSPVNGNFEDIRIASFNPEFPDNSTIRDELIALKNNVGKLDQEVEDKLFQKFLENGDGKPETSNVKEWLQKLNEEGPPLV